ncbi:hypothetical protein HF521_001787 [Silurus meridionalis]|uniref:Ig-like domain-containing protein n=1 Tax=Silurus meridionalis TaxID=175797 RepID=A0A8T0BBY0_SILME|nr:hypothetical protein HF521_001787 [Silurus meridionalis]
MYKFGWGAFCCHGCYAPVCVITSRQSELSVWVNRVAGVGLACFLAAAYSPRSIKSSEPTGAQKCCVRDFWEDPTHDLQNEPAAFGLTLIVTCVSGSLIPMRMELNLFLVLMLSWNLHIAYSMYCKEKNFCILNCGNVSDARLTWSTVLHGKRTNILTNENDKVTKHLTEFRRYSSKGKNLIISNVRHSDAGRFYCNENAMDLSVVTDSTIERVLMLCGAALAGLMFIMATVAAGRAIAHRAWQAGRDSVLRNSQEAVISAVL